MRRDARHWRSDPRKALDMLDFPLGNEGFHGSVESFLPLVRFVVRQVPHGGLLPAVHATAFHVPRDVMSDRHRVALVGDRRR